MMTLEKQQCPTGGRAMRVAIFTDIDLDKASGHDDTASALASWRPDISGVVAPEEC